jgi:hypothetical protein
MNTTLQDFKVDEAAAYAAFERYAEAKRKVEQTLDIGDAREAGRLWREFLNVFLEPERRLTPDFNVIPFRRRS